MASARFLESVRRICDAARIDIPCNIVQHSVELELPGMRVLLVEREDARSDPLIFLCRFEHLHGAHLAPVLARLLRAYRLLGAAGIPCFSVDGPSGQLVMMGRLCSNPRCWRRLRALLGCGRTRPVPSGGAAPCPGADRCAAWTVSANERLPHVRN